MSESDLLANILLTFGSRPGLRIWRSNVLVARDQSGRVVRAGVKGQADISGILAPSGRRIEIECKTAAGRQSPEQRRWQAMIEKYGGIYVLARSVDDVERALSAT
ncbi:MAG: hypothetical protein IT454_20865 [Planctomycetes bacterium]|nr:hypothetical protein [Planctomycetota bacterium]